MISLASLASLNLSINSVAPEKAIWLMYFLISSAVIPKPLSDMVMVFFFSSKATSTRRSPNSPLYWPNELNRLIFLVASTAVDTSSLEKISRSEYKNFLMIGKMFSVWIQIVPFSCIIYNCLVIINFIDIAHQGLFQRSGYCQIGRRLYATQSK